MNKEVEDLKLLLASEVDKQLNALLDFNIKQSSFLEFELQIQKNIKEFGRLILEKMIPLVYGDGYKGSKVNVSEEETYSCVLRKNPRNLKTIFGSIKIVRAYYQFDQSGASLGLLDKDLQIHNYKISPALRYFAGLTGTVTTFREAADILQRLNGIRLSSSEIDVLTEEKAKEAYEIHDEKIAEIQLDRLEKVPPANVEISDNPEKVVYLESDGCFVPTKDDWKECKTLLLFEAEEKDGKSVIKNKLYYSTTNGAAYFKKQVKVKIEEYCSDSKVKFVCIGDGAAWIWNICKELIPKGRVEILDWYHVAERVGIIAAELYPDNETERGELRHELKGYLYNGEHEKAVAKLNQLYEQTRSKELKGLIFQQLGYFDNNKERMHYPDYVKQGYAIGSGAIESANKYVIQRRLKLPGIRWTSENANNMAHIRTEYINGKLDELYGIKENPLLAIT